MEYESLRHRTEAPAEWLLVAIMVQCEVLEARTMRRDFSIIWNVAL
jgi:hypothetical protein